MFIYIPYFYIIQDTRNGMYYAGAKWAKNANPENFMTEDGYNTSSNIIKEIICQHGLSNFIVRKIKTFETGSEAYQYETRFLQKVDAKNHPIFYNKHNNASILTFGSQDFKEIMKEKYGTEYYSQTDEYKEKYKSTCMEKYGKEHFSQTDKYKEKYKSTCMEKYDTKCYTQTDEYIEKSKQTSLKKYGTEYYSQTDEYKEKYKSTCMEKYGVEHTSKTKEHRHNFSKNNPVYKDGVIEKIRDTKKNTHIDGKNLDAVSAERAAKTMKREFINEEGEVTTIYKENGKKLSNTLRTTDLGKRRGKTRKSNYYSSPDCPRVIVRNIFDEKYAEEMSLNEARKISPALDTKTKENYLGMSKFGQTVFTKKGKENLIGLYCERI